MATGKTFESTIEIAGVLSPSLQKAIKSAVDKLEDMSEETLKSVGAAEKLAVEIDAQESALKTLKKGYADYIVENKTSSKEAKKLKDEIEKLSRELKDNKKVLKDAEKKAEDLGDAFDETGDEAKDSSDGFTVMKGALANLVSSGIQAAIDGLKTLASEAMETYQQFDEGADIIIQKTGATGEAAAGLQSVYKNVSKSVVGDYSDIGTAVGEINTRFGLTGDNLESLSIKFLKFAELNGTDVNDSVDNVQKALASFGLGANDAEGFLDTLNKVGQDTGVSMDTLSDLLLENASSFSQMGLDIHQAAAFLGDVEKSGVTVETAMTALSKATQYAAKEGKPLTNTLEQTTEQMKNAKTDAEALQIAYDVFGKKAGAKIYEACKTGTLSFEDLDKAMQNNAGSIDQTYEATQDGMDKIKLALQGAKAEVGDAIASFLDEHKEEIVEVINVVADNLPTIAAALGGLAALGTFANLLLNLGTIVSKLGATKALILKMGPAISKAIGGISGPVGWIILAVVALVAAFVNLWKTNEEFRNKMIGIWEGLKSKFDEFGQGIVDRLNDMGFDFENFGEVVATACEWIKVIWNGFCELLGGTFQFWWQYISDYIGFVLDYITGVFDIFCGIFTGDWELVWQGIKEIFVGIWDFIVNIFKNYLNVWKYAADVILGWFGTSFDEVWGSISSFFVKIWDSIVSFFTNIWKAITDNPIVQWFAKLFESIHNSLVSRIAVAIGLMKGCWKIITTVFGIAFQWFNTKVFTPLKNIFSSVWDSFKSKAVAAWEGIKSVFLPVAEFFGSIFSAAWEKVKSVFSIGGKIFDGVKDGIVSSFKTVVNAIIGGINKVVSVPFAAVNGILNNIRGIEVVGIKPFEGLWGENPLTAPQIPLLAAGGFTDGVSIAGEKGMEAVISFDPAYHDKNVGIWEKAGQLLGVLKNEEQEEGAGLTNKAGKLLTLDDFSLGSLVDGTSVVIYYDFSGFTWNPQFNANGGSHDDEADLMARLRAHEAEFFDWLEEFIKAREVAQYA